MRHQNIQGIILRKYTDNEIDTELYKERMIEIAKRRYLWSVITDKYRNLFGESELSLAKEGCGLV